MIIVITAILGIFLTVAFLVIGLFGSKRIAIKRAGITFFLTLLIMVLYIAIKENKSTEAKEVKKVVFVAAREAPLGGLVLTLYADSTFELRNHSAFELNDSDKNDITGTYKVKGDTVSISTSDSNKIFKDVKMTSFLIKKRILEEIGNSGIVFLDIKENKL